MKTTHIADLSGVEPLRRPFWAYEFDLEQVPLYEDMTQPGVFYVNEAALALGPAACLLGWKVALGQDAAEPLRAWMAVVSPGIKVRPVLSLVAGGLH